MFSNFMWNHFEHLLEEWERASACHDWRTKKEGIYIKSEHMKEPIGIQGTFIFQIKLQMYNF